MPVVESLSVGTPVVVASGSCLEEAGGSSTPVVNPDDADALGHYLSRLINDNQFRQETIDAGRRHALAYSDKNFADEIFNTYLKAISEHRL